MKIGCHLEKRNIKLLLESVACTRITETVTCILQQQQLCTGENITWIIATESPTCINTIKIVTHVFSAETVTCISAAETFNCIIVTETVTCIIGTERPTNITVTESTICIVAIEPQNLNNCIRSCQLDNCCRECQLQVPTENSTCRIDYIQKLSVAEMVPVRDSLQ